jgi:hypothetical protein
VWTLLTGDFVLTGVKPDGLLAPEDISRCAELVEIPYNSSNGLCSWGDIIYCTPKFGQGFKVGNLEAEDKEKR